jgi:osmotically inducible protein OsmC
MPIRTSDATWTGDLKSGKGIVRLGGGAWEGQYNFSSRFEDGEGTNPEELIAAAHAACFSMALANGLAGEGYDVKSVDTRAGVHIDKVPDGFAITTIDLVCDASVPGIDNEMFQKIAEETKVACPVSQVLKGAEITLRATLRS